MKGCFEVVLESLWIKEKNKIYLNQSVSSKISNLVGPANVLQDTDTLR